MTGSSYLRFILFGHPLFLAYKLQSVDPRAFGKGESTVKTAGWDCPDIQTQCPPYVVDGVSKGTAGVLAGLTG